MARVKPLGLGPNLWTEMSRKFRLLDEAERVVPLAAPVQSVQPHNPEVKTGSLPLRIETLLPIHMPACGLTCPTSSRCLRSASCEWRGSG